MLPTWTGIKSRLRAVGSSPHVRPGAGTLILFHGKRLEFRHSGKAKPVQPPTRIENVMRLPKPKKTPGKAGEPAARRGRKPQLRRLNTDLERRLQQQAAQLEAVNRELEAFCYSVSHDLRAPLRSIRGFTDVLIEQYGAQLDSRGRDFLRRASEASVQMDGLIEDLLRLSRLTRGALAPGPVNLSAMAVEVISELRKVEPAREVKCAISPDLRAHADPRLMRVVLEHLLGNAWKFTSKRPDAQIEFGNLPGPEPVFFVRDNGAGFDMAYAGRLFGVFQRLHSAKEFPGAGIGLAIVQRIINRHGGRVWAEGRVDGGATFHFGLPIPSA